MSTTTTLAEQFSSRLNDDGQCWETDEGVSFSDLADQMCADVTYSSREYVDDELNYVDGNKSSYVSGDPIRYEFSDGSAIVEAGDAWDIEGKARFSWAGNE